MSATNPQQQQFLSAIRKWNTRRLATALKADPTLLSLSLCKEYFADTYENMIATSTKYDIGTQLMEFPPLESFEQAAEGEYGLICDQLHFLPHTLTALSKKRGMHVGCFKEDYHRAECRNSVRLFWQQWRKIDGQNCPATFHEFYVKYVCNGEMKCFATPHDQKGRPWNNKNKTFLEKGSAAFKAYKAIENAALAMQMAVAAAIAFMHGVKSKY